MKNRRLSDGSEFFIIKKYLKIGYTKKPERYSFARPSGQFQSIAVKISNTINHTRQIRDKVAKEITHTHT